MGELVLHLANARVQLQRSVLVDDDLSLAMKPLFESSAERRPEGRGSDGFRGRTKRRSGDCLRPEVSFVVVDFDRFSNIVGEREENGFPLHGVVNSGASLVIASGEPNSHGRLVHRAQWIGADVGRPGRCRIEIPDRGPAGNGGHHRPGVRIRRRGIEDRGPLRGSVRHVRRESCDLCWRQGAPEI